MRPSVATAAAAALGEPDPYCDEGIQGVFFAMQMLSLQHLLQRVQWLVQRVDHPPSRTEDASLHTGPPAFGASPSSQRRLADSVERNHGARGRRHEAIVFGDICLKKEETPGL